MWSNDRLKDIICKKLDQIKNHEPFVRKVLFVYWVLKIEDNDEFKKELIMVSKEDISPEDRQAKLQKLSDKYFKHDVSINISYISYHMVIIIIFNFHFHLAGFYKNDPF